MLQARRIAALKRAAAQSTYLFKYWKQSCSKQNRIKSRDGKDNSHTSYPVGTLKLNLIYLVNQWCFRTMCNPISPWQKGQFVILILYTYGVDYETEIRAVDSFYLEEKLFLAFIMVLHGRQMCCAVQRHEQPTHQHQYIKKLPFLHSENHKIRHPNNPENSQIIIANHSLLSLLRGNHNSGLRKEHQRFWKYHDYMVKMKQCCSKRHP